MLKRFGGGQFSAFKSALADVTIEKLAPIRAEMLRLSADPAYVDSVLAEGAEKARVDRAGRIWMRSRTFSASCVRLRRRSSALFLREDAAVRRICVHICRSALVAEPLADVGPFIMVNDFAPNFS